MRSNSSTPLCPNCLQTELYCDANLYIDDEPCCSQCEHRRRPSTDEASD